MLNPPTLYVTEYHNRTSTTDYRGRSGISNNSKRDYSSRVVSDVGMIPMGDITRYSVRDSSGMDTTNKTYTSHIQVDTGKRGYSRTNRLQDTLTAPHRAISPLPTQDKTEDQIQDQIQDKSYSSDMDVTAVMERSEMVLSMDRRQIVIDDDDLMMTSTVKTLRRSVSNDPLAVVAGGSCVSRYIPASSYSRPRAQTAAATDTNNSTARPVSYKPYSTSDLDDGPPTLSLSPGVDIGQSGVIDDVTSDSMVSDRRESDIDSIPSSAGALYARSYGNQDSLDNEYLLDSESCDTLDTASDQSSMVDREKDSSVSWKTDKQDTIDTSVQLTSLTPQTKVGTSPGGTPTMSDWTLGQ